MILSLVTLNHQYPVSINGDQKMGDFMHSMQSAYIPKLTISQRRTPKDQLEVT